MDPSPPGGTSVGTWTTEMDTKSPRWDLDGTELDWPLKGHVTEFYQKSNLNDLNGNKSPRWDLDEQGHVTGL
jgi:hypothetical protein